MRGAHPVGVIASGVGRERSNIKVAAIGNILAHRHPLVLSNSRVHYGALFFFFRLRLSAPVIVPLLMLA